MSTPEAKPASAAATMESFFTRQKANEGVELPLALPDGTPTAHHLRIRGVDSDAFKQAEANSQRRVLESSLDYKDKSKVARVMADERRAVIASLVISWTFDQPCTFENVVKFFTEAPQVEDMVDKLANRRALFYRLGSQNSSPSPAPSSS